MYSPLWHSVKKKADRLRAGGCHSGSNGASKDHQRAIELGEKIQAEDGVGQAVTWISDRLF